MTSEEVSKSVREVMATNEFLIARYCAQYKTDKATAIVGCEALVTSMLGLILGFLAIDQTMENEPQYWQERFIEQTNEALAKFFKSYKARQEHKAWADEVIEVRLEIIK